MSSAVTILIYGLAGSLFLLAGLLALQPLRRMPHRREWILLAMACIAFSILAVVQIADTVLHAQPGAAASPDALSIFIEILFLTAACLAGVGIYSQGRRSLSEQITLTTVKEELQRFQLGFEKEPHILVLKDPKGTYLMTNPAYAQLLGKKSQELDGGTDFNFFPRSQAMAFRQEEEKAIEAGVSQTRDEEWRGVDGNHWFRVTRIPLVDENDSLLGMLISGQEITTQKLAEARLGEWKQGLAMLHEAEIALGEAEGSVQQINLSAGWEHADPQAACESILFWAAKLASATHAGLWQVVPTGNGTPQRPAAILKAGRGKLASLVGNQIKGGEDLVWKVWQSGQTVRAGETSIRTETIDHSDRPGSTPERRTPDQTQPGLETGLYEGIGVPLKIQPEAGYHAQVNWVLTLFHDRPSQTFRDEQVQLLNLFAQMAAYRLQNAERLVACQSELEKRQQALANLQFRARLEHVLAVLAAHFITLDPDKIEEGITRSLQTLLGYTEMDRIYLKLFPWIAVARLTTDALHPPNSLRSPDALRSLDALHSPDVLGPPDALGTPDALHPPGIPAEPEAATNQPDWYCSGSDASQEGSEDYAREDFKKYLEQLNQLEIVHLPYLGELSPETDDTFVGDLQSRGIKSYSAVPLVSNRSVFGYLAFEALRGEPIWNCDANLRAETLTLLKMCSEIFVNLLERMWAAKMTTENQAKVNRQIKALEERNRESALLTEMGDLLQACRTADEAYPIITRYIQRLIQVGSGALYMIHDTKDPAENVAAWGSARPGQAEHELVMNECWGLRRGRIYVVQDPSSEPVCEHLKEPLQAGYMCVPMIAQGVAVGLLHLRLPPGRLEDSFYSENQQRLVVKVAEYIAMALTNLKLRDELRSQAIRDPLTGLFNRRYMEETLEREIRRASRHATSVGIIMFDIDRLKPINDRFGHDAGDLVLKTLGKELLRTFRGEDVACRYGGDEFTIVLPEASLADAWRRAEQIREAVKRLDILYEGDQLGPLTLSIGVSAYPDHGPTTERVLLAGDAASYAAKSEGGDRIMMGYVTEG